MKIEVDVTLRGNRSCSFTCFHKEATYEQVREQVMSVLLQDKFILFRNEKDMTLIFKVSRIVGIDLKELK